MTARKKPAAAAAKKPAAKPKAAPAAKPAAKGPTTKSGTLSAADRKAELAAQDASDKEAREAPAVSVLTKAGWVDADESAGPGLVEHGEGLGRHRPEDGPVAAPGTVILVAPERGAQ